MRQSEYVLMRRRRGDYLAMHTQRCLDRILLEPLRPVSVRHGRGWMEITHRIPERRADR